MSNVYVARSAGLTKWASDVGLGKFVFKVGAADDAEAAVQALNAEAAGGESDWTLVKAQPVEGLDEAAVIARLGRKEKPVDPTYYPRLRGMAGLFKVKLENVENHMLVKQMMENRDAKPTKPKVADIAAYLIHNASR
jgi:hypothetical protein